MPSVSKSTQKTSNLTRLLAEGAQRHTLYDLLQSKVQEITNGLLRYGKPDQQEQLKTLVRSGIVDIFELAQKQGQQTAFNQLGLRKELYSIQAHSQSPKCGGAQKTASVSRKSEAEGASRQYLNLQLKKVQEITIGLNRYGDPNQLSQLKTMIKPAIVDTMILGQNQGHHDVFQSLGIQHELFTSDTFPQEQKVSQMSSPYNWDDGDRVLPSPLKRPRTGSETGSKELMPPPHLRENDLPPSQEPRGQEFELFEFDELHGSDKEAFS